MKKRGKGKGPKGGKGGKGGKGDKGGGKKNTKANKAANKLAKQAAKGKLDEALRLQDEAENADSPQRAAAMFGQAAAAYDEALAMKANDCEALYNYGTLWLWRAVEEDEGRLPSSSGGFGGFGGGGGGGGGGAAGGGGRGSSSATLASLQRAQEIFQAAVQADTSGRGRTTAQALCNLGTVNSRVADSCGLHELGRAKELYLEAASLHEGSAKVNNQDPENLFNHGLSFCSLVRLCIHASSSSSSSAAAAATAAAATGAAAPVADSWEDAADEAAGSVSLQDLLPALADTTQYLQVALERFELALRLPPPGEDFDSQVLLAATEVLHEAAQWGLELSQRLKLDGEAPAVLEAALGGDSATPANSPFSFGMQALDQAQERLKMLEGLLGGSALHPDVHCLAGGNLALRVALLSWRRQALLRSGAAAAGGGGAAASAAAAEAGPMIEALLAEADGRFKAALAVDARFREAICCLGDLYFDHAKRLAKAAGGAGGTGGAVAAAAVGEASGAGGAGSVLQQAASAVGTGVGGGAGGGPVPELLGTACEWLRQAMELDPKDVPTCYNLACAYALAGNEAGCRHALAHAASTSASGVAGGTIGRGRGGGSSDEGWASYDGAAILQASDLASDPDLATVRQAPWFADAVRVLS